jgi:hypothetical protein
VGSLYGFEIKADLPLRRLNEAAGTRGELRIENAMEPLCAPAREPDGVLETEDGQRWYASYELDSGGCLLQLPPTASFLLDAAAGRVEVEAGDGDAEVLEHRIESLAVCTLLARGDDLVLHAAAIEVGGRAVVFCGPSRRGKSTLARALGEAGCRLLGEDGIVIELGTNGPVAHPGARGVRERRPDGNGRDRIELLSDPGPGEPGPCPVAAVVLLGERGEEFSAETLPAARALALLTPNLVHSGGRTSIATAFQRLATLLGSVPVLSISLADDLAALPAATRSILDATPVHG